MVSIETIKKLEGLQTIETIQNKLGITRPTAVKYVYEMRKKGFVETKGGGKQPRFYRISALKLKETGNPGLIETINKYSRIKIRGMKTRIIGKKLTLEEGIIRAIESKDFRVILASLGLFNHIKNWSLLYKLAKEKGLRKEVGALYDVARSTIKTKRMDKRIYDKLLSEKNKKRFIVNGLKSMDFRDIENKWDVFLPFNKKDFWRYKE